MLLSNVGNSYGGATAINSGATLEIKKLANGGSVSSIGSSSSDASNLVLGGTLKYSGSGESTDRLFTLSTGTIGIQSSGAGAVKFTNTGAIVNGGTGVRSLTLSGDNTGDNTIAGAISDNGANKTSLSKTNAGKWILTGNSTYTGATTVLGGTLQVDGSISSSAVTVGDSGNLATAAILAGSGRVGAVTVGAAAGNTGAQVNPSNDVPESIGTSARLTTTSFTMLGSGSSTLVLQIGRTTPGTSNAGDCSDRIIASSVDLGSTANLRLTLQSGYAPTVGDIFYLITNSSSAINTGFSTVNELPITGNQFSFNGDLWDITYSALASGGSFSGGHDVAIRIGALPEAQTSAMFLAGMGLLLFLKRARART